MAPYDSESSGDEDTEFSKTNVVLGFAAKDSAEHGDTISHIGGRPDWIDPATPPSAKLARCKVCNDMLVLLLQLNGDLPEVFPGHERRIYVLGCRRKTCRRKEGSVRAFRSVRITQNNKEKKAPEVETKPKPVAHIGESLFGAKPSTGGGGGSSSMNPFGSSNPFSSPSSASAGSSNPFAAAGLSSPSTLSAITPQASSPTADLPKSFAAALSLNNVTTPPTFGPAPPPEPWPQDSDLPKPYPSYYLEDDTEWLDKLPAQEIPTQMMDLDEPSGSSSGGGKEDKEVYESTIDSTFQKFADRLEQNPEQVIRYEFKGTPLLYSKADAVGKLLAGSGHGNGEGKVRVENAGGGRMPRCVNCGAARVFEVQLTPHAIMELEREEGGVDGMEWGTVVVGVCERDCNEKEVEGRKVGYVEEWAGVQWEELRR